ncbi:MAG TPA: DUF4249 domain-containing protein [Bacteroidia bacterium]
MKKLFLYIAILFMFACKREIIVDIPNREASLVVDSEISPDSFIKVKLSRTQNITDNNPPKIPFNCLIEVMDKDTGILDVLTDMGKGVFASNFLKPSAGKTYLFRITADSRTYWVNERMPDSLKCKVMDTSRIIFQGKQNFYQFTLDLEDQSNRGNYYGLRLKRHYKQFAGTDTTIISEWVTIESLDFLLTENPATRFSNRHLLFNDKYFGNMTANLKFGANGLFGKSNERTYLLELYVSSYSESAYNFYTSLNEHLFYQNDPFSQPTLLKGNISEAFGAIVGSYTQVFKFEFN